VNATFTGGVTRDAKKDNREAALELTQPSGCCSGVKYLAVPFASIVSKIRFVPMKRSMFET
jgi:hypothetical protein